MCYSIAVNAMLYLKPTGRLMEPPPRSSGKGSLLISAIAVLLSVVPFLPEWRGPAAGFAVLLLIAAVLLKEAQALHPALFTVLLTSVPLPHPSLRDWPFKLLVPVILYLAAVLLVPHLRKTFFGIRPGRLGTGVPRLAAGIIFFSGITLLLWTRLLGPDLSIHLRSMPAMPVWVYPFAGLAFAAGNAATEEFVYRGVLMQALDSAFGPGRASLVIQAWLFGSMHYRGFPTGPRASAWLSCTEFFSALSAAARGECLHPGSRTQARTSRSLQS